MSRARVKKGGGRARSFSERKILVKSPEPEKKRRERLKREILENYEWELSVDYLGIIFWELLVGIIVWELSVEIIVWELSPSISSRRKVEIYRDTGVYKNVRMCMYVYYFVYVLLTGCF